MHIGESPTTIREETRSVAAMSDWRHHALCRDEDPELFFPIGTSGPAVLQVEQAKAVCQRCPVTSECLQWALDSGQDAGVWGGMSESERRLLKRKGGVPGRRTTPAVGAQASRTIVTVTIPDAPAAASALPPATAETPPTTAEAP